MNFLHRRHQKLTEVVPVPDGLRELMADITREVLRYQPENIEKFIADYLEAMVITRELCCIANRTVEDIIQSSCLFVELLRKEGISQEQAESAVKIVHEEFKSHSEGIDEKDPLKELDIINRLINECNLSIEQAQNASGIIEKAWCHYYQRNKKNPMRLDPNIAQLGAVKNTLSLHQKSKAICGELRKIPQTGFIGYLGRKSQNNKIKIRETSNSSSSHQKREEAAIKIQSWYRGLKEKQNFKKVLNAAKVIQKRFKEYLRRVNKENRAKSVSKSSETLEPLDKARNDAAVKIQSYFRAYKDRKEFRSQQKAATTIQSYIRRFLARKIKK